MDTTCIRLTDLIGLDELQKIQDSFALATGVGACIHQVDGTPITSPSNWCELCVNYNRKSGIGIIPFTTREKVGSLATRGDWSSACGVSLASLVGGLLDAN
jgi:ligand-binding sensor protein